ncbi:MAG TPA: hypothetical protein VFY17_06620 [Pilimelia sp.]|nr:hypothetical protein [Pilimelia sp.]
MTAVAADGPADDGPVRGDEPGLPVAPADDAPAADDTPAAEEVADAGFATPPGAPTGAGFVAAAFAPRAAATGSVADADRTVAGDAGVPAPRGWGPDGCLATGWPPLVALAGAAARSADPAVVRDAADVAGRAPSAADAGGASPAPARAPGWSPGAEEAAGSPAGRAARSGAGGVPRSAVAGADPAPLAGVSGVADLSAVALVGRPADGPALVSAAPVTGLSGTPFGPPGAPPPVVVLVPEPAPGVSRCVASGAAGEGSAGFAPPARWLSAVADAPVAGAAAGRAAPAPAAVRMTRVASTSSGLSPPAGAPAAPDFACVSVIN